jgi:hypothetical protein
MTNVELWPSLSGPLRLNETEDAQVTTLVLKLLQLSSGLNFSLWEFEFREEARRIVQGR